MEEPPLPEAPAPAAPPRPRTPWGLRDMAMAVGLIIVGVIAISLPAALLASFIAGDAEIDEDPGALVIVLVASLLLELLIIAAAAIFSVRKYGVSWADLGLRTPRRGGYWLPFVLALGGLVLVYLFVLILDAFDAAPESSVPEGMFNNAGPAVLLGVLALVFAPIMEETFFRGFLFGGLRGRWGTLWAALASGLLFGLAHLGNPGSVATIVPIAAVGVLFAFGYAYSGSIVAAILAHFLFNTVSYIAGFAA